MNPLKKLAGQTAIYGLGTIIPRLLNYLLVPFYTRIFPDDQYGIITELYAYMAFLLVLLTYGMETAFFRYAEKEEDPKKVLGTSLFSLLITSAFFIFLVVIFLNPISSAIKYEDQQQYILYFAVIVAMDAFAAIPFAYLRKQNKALRFSLIKVANVVVNIALNLYFLWLCPLLEKIQPGSVFLSIYDPSFGVGYVFISNIISSLVTLLLVMPEIFSVKIRADLVLLKKMLVYAFPLLIMGLAGMINEVSDKIIFKFLARYPEGTENPEAYVMGQLGIFGANYKLAVLMTIFTQMFRYAAEPFFFAQAKESNAKQVYAAVLKYFIIFALIIFLMVVLYIDIFKYFIGPAYWEGLKIVPIILLANLLLGIVYNLSIWYKLQDLTKFGAYITLIAAVVTIALNIILVPLYSYVGAAWSHLACYFVAAVLSYFLGRKYYHVDYDLKKIGFYIALALGLFFLSHVWNDMERAVRIGLNSVLFAGFLGIVLASEWKNLKKSL